MAPEFVHCPVCKQNLAIQEYVLKDNEVVCANPNCMTTLRITSRRPLKVEVIPENETLNANDRPEAYG